MDILSIPTIQSIATIATELYKKGWGEANGGNVSIRLTDDEMTPFTLNQESSAETSLPFAVPELAETCFLVTGTGVFFRHIAANPESALGIVRLNTEGDGYTIIWGFNEGGRPTSELPSHLLSHASRKNVNQGRDKIILHTHATNLIALSFLLPLDSRVITRELWEMMSECLVLFPEGIGVIPWMVPGGAEIGMETARLIKKHRLVLWAHHGIFGAGQTMDQVFGLIETAEKAAEMLLKVMAAGGKKQAINSDQLKALAKAFKVDCPDEMFE